MRYMVSDTDLAKGEIPPLRGEASSTTQQEIDEPNEDKKAPGKNISSPKKKVKFWFLLAANVIVLTVLYNLLAPESFWKPATAIASLTENIQGWKSNASDKIKLTGIMYYDQKPSAMVCGQVVYEGDTIAGYKVVKIHRQKVEFEKDGIYSTKQLSR